MRCAEFIAADHHSTTLVHEAQRFIHQGDEADEGHQHPERQVAGDHLPAAHRPHHQAAELGQEGDGRKQGGQRALRVAVGAVHLVVDRPEAVDLVLLLAERLDHADAAQGVLHHAVEDRQRAVLAGEQAPELRQQPADDQYHQRRGDQQQQRQRPVEGDHRRHDRHDLQQVDAESRAARR